MPSIQNSEFHPVVLYSIQPHFKQRSWFTFFTALLNTLGYFTCCPTGRPGLTLSRQPPEAGGVLGGLGPFWELQAELQGEPLPQGHLHRRQLDVGGRFGQRGGSGARSSGLGVPRVSDVERGDGELRRRDGGSAWGASTPEGSERGTGEGVSSASV